MNDFEIGSDNESLCEMDHDFCI